MESKELLYVSQYFSRVGICFALVNLLDNCPVNAEKQNWKGKSEEKVIFFPVRFDLLHFGCDAWRIKCVCCVAFSRYSLKRELNHSFFSSLSSNFLGEDKKLKRLKKRKLILAWSQKQIPLNSGARSKEINNQHSESFMLIFKFFYTWFSIKLSLFYKTLIVPERRRPRLSQCSVKRRLREGGGRKLESLCLSSSSSGPAPGSCWRWESHSKQRDQERRLQLPEISAAWSYHRRRRSPSHPDTLHSEFKYRK